MQGSKVTSRKILAVPVSYHGLNRAHETVIEAPFWNGHPMEENPLDENRTQNGGSRAWYCLRSRRNQECAAAARLKTLAKVQVFCPQIRFQRRLNGSQKGSLVTETLFPGYFFARFLSTEVLPIVEQVSDIWGLVSLDEKPLVIEESLIRTLRAEASTVVKGLVPGDRVRLADRGTSGPKVVITGILSGNERVQALLDFIAFGTNPEAPRKNALMRQSEPRVLRFSTRFAVISSNRALKPSNGNALSVAVRARRIDIVRSIFEDAVIEG
jgi:transcriptional antiterminator RfaH